MSSWRVGVFVLFCQVSCVGWVGGVYHTLWHSIFYVSSIPEKMIDYLVVKVVGLVRINDVNSQDGVFRKTTVYCLYDFRHPFVLGEGGRHVIDVCHQYWDCPSAWTPRITIRNLGTFLLKNPVSCLFFIYNHSTSFDMYNDYLDFYSIIGDCVQVTFLNVCRLVCFLLKVYAYQG